MLFALDNPYEIVMLLSVKQRRPKNLTTHARPQSDRMLLHNSSVAVRGSGGSRMEMENERKQIIDAIYKIFDEDFGPVYDAVRDELIEKIFRLIEETISANQ